MNRRESLKTLVIGSLASSLFLEGCLPKEKEIIYEMFGNTNTEEHLKN